MYRGYNCLLLYFEERWFIFDKPWSQNTTAAKVKNIKDISKTIFFREYNSRVNHSLDFAAFVIVGLEERTLLVCRVTCRLLFIKTWKKSFDTGAQYEQANFQGYSSTE